MPYQRTRLVGVWVARCSTRPESDGSRTGVQVCIERVVMFTSSECGVSVHLVYVFRLSNPHHSTSAAVSCSVDTAWCTFEVRTSWKACKP